MPNTNDLIVKITAPTNTFGQQLREASQRLSRFVSETNGSLAGFRAVSNTLADVGGRLSIGVTAPMALLAAGSVRASADLERLKMGLVAVAGSTAVAETQLKRLQEVAKLPGLGFREAVQGAVNLQASGYSAQLAERALKSFGNALATVGRGKADLDGVILALGQIASKGKISAEEINQLAERVPQIRVAMKAAFGTADTEALQKMQISATEFVEKVSAELGKLPPVTGGVANSLENMEDRLQQTLSSIGDSFKPATLVALEWGDKTLQAVDKVAKGFKDAPAWIQGATGVLIGLAAATGPAVAGIGQLGLALAGIAAGGRVVAGITAVGLATTALGAILATLTVGAIYAGYELTAAFLGARDAAKEADAAAVGLAKARGKLADSLFAKATNDQQRSEIRKLYLDLEAGRISAQRFDLEMRKIAISLGTMGRSAQGATGQVANFGEELQRAYAKLGITPQSALKQSADDARKAYETVKAAYAQGKATTADLTRAQNALNESLRALSPVAKSAADSMEGIKRAVQGPLSLTEYWRKFVDEAKSASAEAAREMADKGFEPMRKMARMITSGELWDTREVQFQLAAVGGEMQNVGYVAGIVQRHVQGLYAEFGNTTAIRTGERALRDLAASLGAEFDPNRARKLSEARGTLGISAPPNTKGMAEALEQLRQYGASSREILTGEMKLLQARQDAGETLTQAEVNRLRYLEATHKATSSSVSMVWQEVQSRLVSVFQDTSKALTDLIFKGGKFKDVMVNAGLEISKAFTRLALEKTFAGIGTQLAKFGSKIPGLAGLLSKLPGFGSTVSQALPASVQMLNPVAGMAGSAGGIGSAVSGLGSAVGKIAGLAGAIGSVGSMVTGVIGAFQQAKSNKIMAEMNRGVIGLVGNSTGLNEQINAYLPALASINDRLIELRQIGIRVWTNSDSPLDVVMAGGGTAGGVTINMAGANFVGFRDLDAFIDEIVRRLKQRGV